MANHQRRAISDRVTRMLLYAPACRKDDFLYAIGYLIRRLDENTVSVRGGRPVCKPTPLRSNRAAAAAKR